MSAATSALPVPPTEPVAPPDAAEILRDGSYALTIFTQQEVDSLGLFWKNNKPYLKCLASDRDRPAKPEEIVRQLYVRRLMTEYGYPKERISVEWPVSFGGDVKRADIVIHDEHDSDAAYIVIEVKRPKRKDGLAQLQSYCNATAAPLGVWTNGGTVLCLSRRAPGASGKLFLSISDIPGLGQTLDDVLNERWTLADLEKHNKLDHERLSLKSVILDMEDLVLANAGVDAFEEVFKLIYAKLYDEWYAARGGSRTRYLEFRVGGKTPAQFKDVIDRLFNAAKNEWKGVFSAAEKIDLSAPHLLICGSFLEDIRLFNSNLQVIDEAFEYLSLKARKGEKGQFFTPRHVIDMCVQMMNPSVDDLVIDTAAGSCGFTVHAIFHVWGNQFTAGGPERWQSEYAGEKVYAIDFDARSVKIAKALNLIAGDGKTHVYHANTLDPTDWSEEARAGMRPRTRRSDREFHAFDFDVVLTNPPFAGKVKESRLIHQYAIARKPNGRWESTIGRDILFIERNLEFLKPGGRMAVVLPQGIFNSDKYRRVREFIGEHARVLGVVGLHSNTFMPHTGTKTSVLLLQKWNDDPDAGPLRPRVADYPVFFAASREPGKDGKGNYVYVKDATGKPAVDAHGHLIVKHDLGIIAAAFREWALSQGLVFAEEA